MGLSGWIRINDQEILRKTLKTKMHQMSLREINSLVAFFHGVSGVRTGGGFGVQNRKWSS